ncbi:MarR family winged helix-turn-helix transcriptional regulator [Streptomyces sp. WP-1]|uniref:MarR family winged helix-turn-helix transcriptional regulator n=1 Tax=Streptomyces sp. WP-1 TaxID=3041497 RepID=UPI0026483F93|nr:MarR family transcriptional regulator [Streptomyces sp. WP-1]WKE69771.1 MarR family transcriptional regulator [Streptomyces sp. WP-1]
MTPGSAPAPPPASTPPPSPSDTAQRLNQAMKRLRARLRAESGQHATGLTATQLAVLAEVVREGPVTAARLAALEHVTPQAIAQSLTVLKAAGLVHGAPDPRDGRRKLISADPSAGALIERLLAGRASFLARAITQVVKPEERDALEKAVELLERLAGAGSHPHIP